MESLVHSKGETVLFVDDEKMMRDLGSTFLKKLGYDVLLAEDGEKALEVYTQHRNKIAIIMLDMTMPKLPGREAIKRLIGINPAIKILACSGYTSEGDEKDIIKDGARAFLRKPYTIGKLAGLLRTVLDA